MLVSVVLAVYNEEKYIATTLESIITQNIEKEIIVVDDHSIDNTFVIVSNYSKCTSNLKLVKNPTKGKVSAFNYGVSLARGQWVCLFAGDDIMPADSLAARYNFINQRARLKYPIVGLFKIRTICDDLRFDGHIFPKAKDKGNPSGQSPIMNKECVELLFPIPEELPNEDTWLEIAFDHLNDHMKIYHSNIICCDWRIHSGNSYNFSLSNRDYKLKLISRWIAYELFLDKFHSFISDKSKTFLKERIKATNFYEKNELMKLLYLRLNLMEKVRIISTMNEITYFLRKNVYRLFSGW